MWTRCDACNNQITLTRLSLQSPLHSPQLRMTTKCDERECVSGSVSLYLCEALSMCVCVWVCVCGSVEVCVCVCVCVCVSEWVCLCVSVYLFVSVSLCGWVAAWVGVGVGRCYWMIFCNIAYKANDFKDMMCRHVSESLCVESVCVAGDIPTVTHYVYLIFWPHGKTEEYRVRRAHFSVSDFDAFVGYPVCLRKAPTK